MAGPSDRLKEEDAEDKRAEEALREGGLWYRTIFENTGTATVVIEENTVISLANSEFASLSGYSKEEIEGKTSWTSFVVREDLDRMLAQHQKRRQSREKALRHYEFRFVRKDGSIRDIYLTIDVIPGTKSSIASLMDITERKRAEEELHRKNEELSSLNEEITATEEELRQQYDELSIRERELTEIGLWYRTVFENTGTATVVLEESALISLANSEFASLSGYSKEEIEGKQRWTDFVLKEDLDRMLAQHQKRRQSREKALRHYEFRFVRKDGTVRDIYLTIDVIPGTKSSIASLMDITERKRAEEELHRKNEELSSLNEEITATEEELRQQYDELSIRERELAYSEARLNTLLSNSPIPLLAIGLDHKVTYWSKAMEKFSGIKAADIVGTNRHWKAFYKEEKPLIIDLLLDGSREDFDRWYQGNYSTSRTFDGAYEAIYQFPQMGKWLHAIAIAIEDREGRTIGGLEIFEDVTDGKVAEEQIKASLKEKETLLKEIHHRVKNNLQIISSLLSLQSASINDSESLGVFRESQNRIRSMALIHEKLYQSKNLAEVDFAEYIKSLSNFLYYSYIPDRERVLLVLDIEKVTLGIDTAIPCGLIINELITNSLKHAFPGNRTGKLTVKLRSVGDDSVNITISDDGIGLPEGFSPEKSQTLGMELVSTLIDQINGNIQIARDKGAVFSITFRDRRT